MPLSGDAMATMGPAAVPVVGVGIGAGKGL